MHRVTTGHMIKVTISTAQIEATFSSWFVGPYKVDEIGYGLFLYALQPAKRTSSSFIGAILEEYLVQAIFSLLQPITASFSLSQVLQPISRELFHIVKLCPPQRTTNNNPQNRPVKATLSGMA